MPYKCSQCGTRRELRWCEGYRNEISDNYCDTCRREYEKEWGKDSFIKYHAWRNTWRERNPEDTDAKPRGEDWNLNCCYCPIEERGTRMLYAPHKEDDDYDVPDFVCFRCMREYATDKCDTVSVTWPEDTKESTFLQARATIEWVYEQIGKDATLEFLNKMAVEFADKDD